MEREFEKELQDLSPFLAELKKQQPKEPFKTPRFYFDTLADTVLEKAKSETIGVQIPPQYKTSPSVLARINDWLSTLMQPKLALSVLAMALVIVAAWFMVQKDKPTVGVDTPQVAVETSPVGNVNVSPIAKVKENETIAAISEPNKVNKMGQETTAKAVEPTTTTPSTPLKTQPLTHPKSGLTEEEIEMYLKENLNDEDIDALAGK